MTSATFTGEVLSVLMFVVVIPMLLLGYPVVFTLAGVGFGFGLLGHFLGAFDLTYFNALPLRYWGILTNDVLIAVPLFIFMGVMLERSGIAEDLLRTLGELFGRIRGGLAFAVILVGSLLAASTGIVGATVTTMALISLPVMLRTGYDKRVASGLICATGTLAQIIPPSTVLVFLAVIMQTANSQVQLAKGNFTPATLSVGDLFAGAFIPGLLLSLLYTLWIVGLVILRPEKCPAMVSKRSPDLYRMVVVALAPTLILIIAVLGSIIAGIATPTEAAAVGAIGAIVLTMVRLIGDSLAKQFRPDLVGRVIYWYWLGTVAGLTVLALLGGALGMLTGAMILGAAAFVFIALHGQTRAAFVKVMTEVTRQSLNLTVMVFVIFLGATVFSLVFTRLGGDAVVATFLNRLPGGVHGAVAVVMLIVFVLGMFLDTFEILFIVVPISAPILLAMDVDPIWLSIMLAINLQTSYLTPPFGFSLFFLRGVAPPEVRTTDIYRGIVPFVALQVVCLGVVWRFPDLALWLPKLLYRH
jgi:TRAP-type mannitol/chloroaromatic compound transport system permease large subunit